ncbi:MAG TPA: 2-C-methyl-D-erythritol 4-phosphate cytidylyltransferase [Dehalococcoidia bacterium]|nr:2-C-methyl-D-erythritol 4-phosphate cytidylyltransferase [Dehalococcoidia bacterium]
MEKQKTAAVIVAAGSSERMGGTDKVFSVLDGKSVLVRVIEVFQACHRIDDIVIVLNQQNLKEGKRLVAEEGWSKVKGVCEGGKRRQDSVLNGLNCLGNCDWVVIHDGARPLVTAGLIENGLDAAEETGAVIAAVPVTDTIKMAADDLTIQGTPPRQSLWAAQTPQIFRYNIITNAYQKLKYEVTDDARAVELTGGSVKIYQGSNDNIKITTPEDLSIAEMLLKKRMK